MNISYIGTERIDTELLFLQLFFDAEQNGGVLLFICQFTISKGQSEGEQFYFRLFDIIGESVTGASGINADFGAQVVFGHVIESVEDTVFNLSDGIFNCNTGALVAEVSTALISSPGGPPARRAHGSER